MSMEKEALEFICTKFKFERKIDTIITIINKAFASEINFLLPVLIPTQMNPKAAQKTRVAKPYSSGINTRDIIIINPVKANNLFFIS